jgi:hypothetical protein
MVVGRGVGRGESGGADFYDVRGCVGISTDW